jgi:serine/threonine-protein kinase ULK/ATG1
VADSSASALQFLHERNISHLDLKPQNILLSSLEKPHLKLAGLRLEQQGGSSFRVGEQ